MGTREAPVVAPNTILNSSDRCDVRDCGARAYVRGLFEDIRPDQKTAAIDMCRHHFLLVPPKFHEQAYHIIDETAGIS